VLASQQSVAKKFWAEAINRTIFLFNRLRQKLYNKEFILKHGMITKLS